MDTYNNKLERVQKTFSCIQLDRVPIFELFWIPFLKKWWKEKGLDPGTDIYEFYDMDLTIGGPNSDPGLESYKLLTEGQNYKIIKSGFGCIIKQVSYSPQPQFLDFPIKSSDDYDTYKIDDPNDRSRYYKENAALCSDGDGFTMLPPFSEQLKARKDKIPMAATLCEGMEKSWRARGMEGVFMDIASEKKKFKKFLKRLEEFEIQIGLNEIKMGVDFLFIAGDVAYTKGMFFSPDTWREFFKPHLYNMCQAFKKEKPDIKLIYHGCGNSTAVFKDYIECGIDAYHALEVKSGIDVIDLKRKYKNKLAYIGNIDCRDVFPGSKENLKKDLLRKLNAAKGGGYIPSADHSIPDNVPVENYDYFVSLLREYGKYPLELGEYDIPELNNL